MKNIRKGPKGKGKKLYTQVHGDTRYDREKEKEEAERLIENGLLEVEKNNEKKMSRVVKAGLIQAKNELSPDSPLEDIKKKL